MRPLVSMRKGLAAERDRLQREASLRDRSVAWDDSDVPDVLLPDACDAEDTGATTDDWLATGMRELVISDETGRIIDWPWETGATGGARAGRRMDGDLVTLEFWIGFGRANLWVLFPVREGSGGGVLGRYRQGARR